MTEEDLIRLLESRHDIQAVANPARLTSDPGHQISVANSREELSNARELLVARVALTTREASETDNERTNVKNTLGNALEHYRFFRNRAYDALLNLPPGTRLPDEEITRRQRLYDRYFKLNYTQLSRQALEKQVEVLDNLVAAHETEEDLRNLGHSAQLEAAIRPAIAAIQEYHRETREDLMATSALIEARTIFDRAHRAHVLLVESLLVRHGLENEAGHFLKRRDAAYAARRRSKTSVTQEPEAATIETEIQQTQETTPA